MNHKSSRSPSQLQTYSPKMGSKQDLTVNKRSKQNGISLDASAINKVYIIPKDEIKFDEMYRG